MHFLKVKNNKHLYICYSNITILWCIDPLFLTSNLKWIADLGKAAPFTIGYFIHPSILQRQDTNILYFQVFHYYFFMFLFIHLLCLFLLTLAFHLQCFLHFFIVCIIVLNCVKALYKYIKWRWMVSQKKFSFLFIMFQTK